MKKLAILTACAVLGLTIPIANAESVFAAIKYSKFDMELDGESAKPSGLEINIGKYFGENFGIEALAGFGFQDDEFFAAQDFDTHLSFRGALDRLLGAGGIAKFPLGKTIEFYGKAGFALLEWKISVEATRGGQSASASQSYDDTGIYIGAGAAVNFNENTALTIEYLKLPDVDVRGATIESSSISLGIRFSN